MAQILIIEDEIQLAEAYSFLLQHKGHSVEWASDGEKGLQQAATVQPDLILLDMMMPNLDGLGFLERYKELKPKHVKIIIMSNMQSREHQDRALELGAYRYEIKAALAPQQLMQIVDEALVAYK